MDRESGYMGKIRTGCEDRTQDRDGTGHIEEMARKGKKYEVGYFHRRDLENGTLSGNMRSIPPFVKIPIDTG